MSLDHGMLSIPNRTRSIDRELDRYKAEQAAKERSERTAAIAQRKANKARAKELQASHGAALCASTSNPKASAHILDQMVKWQPARAVQILEQFAAKEAA